MRRRKGISGSCVTRLCGLVLALVCCVGRVSAQGFGLGILDHPSRGSEWFATESLDLRGHGRWSIGMTTDWAHKTLEAGARNRAIVKNQLLLQPGLAVILLERLRFAVDVPVQLYGGGTALEISGRSYEPPEHKVSLGDVRLGAVVRLFGEHTGVITGALGVQVALPTGNEAAYAGDGSTRVLPHLMLAGDYAGFTYAGKLGAGIRTRSFDVLDTDLASYAYFALSLGVRMFERRFVLGPELLGQTQLSGDALFKRRATPVEALLGLHYSFDNGTRLGAAIGFGLSSGIGAPQQRGLLSIEWNPPVPRTSSEQPLAAADRDGDGIPDAEDACPTVPGRLTAEPQRRGCPPPLDTDGDGVRDVEDACPDHKGERNPNAAISGCPYNMRMLNRLK